MSEFQHTTIVYAQAGADAAEPVQVWPNYNLRVMPLPPGFTSVTPPAGLREELRVIWLYQLAFRLIKDEGLDPAQVDSALSYYREWKLAPMEAVHMDLAAV